MALSVRAARVGEAPVLDVDQVLLAREQGALAKRSPGGGRAHLALQARHESLS